MNNSKILIVLEGMLHYSNKIYKTTIHFSLVKRTTIKKHLSVSGNNKEHQKTLNLIRMSIYKERQWIGYWAFLWSLQLLTGVINGN